MSTPRTITRLVTAHQQREGGGFVVKRPIGGEVSDLDPFLLLDHFGPVEYGPGEAVGAPDHPHRGFETVTYIISGSMQHKDSAGNTGTLSPGMGTMDDGRFRCRTLRNAERGRHKKWRHIGRIPIVGQPP